MTHSILELEDHFYSRSNFQLTYTIGSILAFELFTLLQNTFCYSDTSVTRAQVIIDRRLAHATESLQVSAHVNRYTHPIEHTHIDTKLL